jgi:hypothetical protein
LTSIISCECVSFRSWRPAFKISQLSISHTGCYSIGGQTKSKLFIAV